MMSLKRLGWLVFVFALLSVMCSGSFPTKIGVDEPFSLQVDAGNAREDVVSFPGATYIAVHFF